jgi:hypothetical protein
LRKERLRERGRDWGSGREWETERVKTEVTMFLQRYLNFGSDIPFPLLHALVMYTKTVPNMVEDTQRMNSRKQGHRSQSCCPQLHRWRRR